MADYPDVREVDLTSATEAAAKGRYQAIAETYGYGDWESLDPLSKFTWKENAHPYVVALHEAGLLKE